MNVNYIPCFSTTLIYVYLPTSMLFVRRWRNPKSKSNKSLVIICKRVSDFGKSRLGHGVIKLMILFEPIIVIVFSLFFFPLFDHDGIGLWISQWGLEITKQYLGRHNGLLRGLDLKSHQFHSQDNSVGVLI
ncbi:hypothetical protein RHMOL_Rhmol05G0189300 [Rhododendron molle]|uniref:Uncharacterized protein n=1 Tax=Rhododendron molle TaxID=49168 RepID=A0ACC0NQW3_RHOML|nr:hypothetical protein RHMOL_Rhmol05G0189300 [Rhododendron molle]